MVALVAEGCWHEGTRVVLMERFSVAVIYYGRDAAKEVKMKGMKEPSTFVSLWSDNTEEEEMEDAGVTVMLASLCFI